MFTSLQFKYPTQKTNWHLVVTKAKKWVARQAAAVSTTPQGVDFLKEAKKFASQQNP